MGIDGVRALIALRKGALDVSDGHFADIAEFGERGKVIKVRAGGGNDAAFDVAQLAMGRDFRRRV